jgi:hypothetical protein
MKIECADTATPAANRYRRAADRKYPAVKAATYKFHSLSLQPNSISWLRLFDNIYRCN